MEEEEGSCPSETNRFSVIDALDMNMIDLSKKRKLLSKQLDLPPTKHKCLDHGCDSIILKVYVEKPEYAAERQSEREGSHEESQPESAKDSNSFAEYSDTAMSESADSYFKQGCAMTITTASTSSVKWACNSSQSRPHSSDGKKALLRGDNEFEVGQQSIPHHDSESHMCELLEEQLLEFGYDYVCSDNAEDCLKSCSNKEVEDSFNFNGLTANHYVLSSGRWSNSHDSQDGSTQPTIDKEFEDYFSTLMM